MNTPVYEFLRQAGRIINSGQARTLVLTGATGDLYYLPVPDLEGGGRYVPLLDFLTAQWDVSDRILVVYELNGPIRFMRAADREKVKDAWLKLRTGLDANELAIQNMLRAGRAEAELAGMSAAFDGHLQQAIGKPTLALELLRQMCLASRTELNGTPLLHEALIIIIEAADMVIPEAELTRLSDADRHRVAICQDWFSDPGFMDADDAVVLLSESRSLLNQRIAQLPQVVEVVAEAADEPTRRHFIDWFNGQRPAAQQVSFAGGLDRLATLTAGLSIHALNQLLRGAAYEGNALAISDVVAMVQNYIQSQLGADIVEFKKPRHTLDDVVGFSRLKAFLRAELIPRFRSSGPDALPGAAVAGPIGGGKTFIFEAVAAELDMVVLVLKNIRSQWFGQTDVIFERLRRVLNALSKVLIFVDEADTQFGQVGRDAHATERRLTGKIQAMMSDPALRGRVVWLLMTARIHLLSPDIRRPGRTGDLIIPVLDPTGVDRQAFVRWAVAPVLRAAPHATALAQVEAAVPHYAAANFASLRAELIAKAGGGTLALDEVLAVVQDLLPPNIERTRRYQSLQALLNCTRRSLLPDPDIDEQQRRAWRDELEALEREGVR